MNNITTITALASVLGITIDEQTGKYVRKVGGIIVPLCDTTGGKPGERIRTAIILAMESVHLNEVCAFAIFPMTTHRSHLYMMIERDLMQQENELGAPMWAKLSEKHDSREVVDTLFLQLRDCAVNWNNPQKFEMHLRRVLVLGVASLQWAHKWVAALIKRQDKRTTGEAANGAELTMAQRLQMLPNPVPSDPPPPDEHTDVNDIGGEEDTRS